MAISQVLENLLEKIYGEVCFNILEFLKNFFRRIHLQLTLNFLKIFIRPKANCLWILNISILLDSLKLGAGTSQIKTLTPFMPLVSFDTP